MEGRPQNLHFYKVYKQWEEVSIFVSLTQGCVILSSESLRKSFRTPHFLLLKFLSTNLVVKWWTGHTSIRSPLYVYFTFGFYFIIFLLCLNILTQVARSPPIRNLLKYFLTRLNTFIMKHCALSRAVTDNVCNSSAFFREGFPNSIQWTIYRYQ